MAKSPIWDSTTGFGGDGDKNAERSVGHGHCITDGPFANQTALFFGVENRSHCLSRGFVHGKHLQTIFGSKVKPEALEAVLLEEADMSTVTVKPVFTGQRTC
jgi:tyrosinase